jgi:hypothetical protein
VSAKALFEFRDVIRVWIEFRAPKKGELMWTVPENHTPAEALEHVICGRDDWASGEGGFGYHASRDMPEFEPADEDDNDRFFLQYRNIVVHVEHVRTEPRLDNTISHVKLL